MSKKPIKTRVDAQFKETFKQVAESSDKSQAEALKEAARLYVAMETGGASVISAALSGEDLDLDTAALNDDAHEEEDEESEYVQYSVETAPPIAPGEADFADKSVVPQTTKARLAVLRGFVRYFCEQDETQMALSEFKTLIKEEFGVGNRTAAKYVDEATERGFIFPHLSVHHEMAGWDAMKSMRDFLTEWWHETAESSSSGDDGLANQRYQAYAKAQSTRELSMVYVSEQKGLVDGWFDKTEKIFFDEDIARSVARQTLESWACEAHSAATSGLVLTRAARLAITEYDVDTSAALQTLVTSGVSYPEGLEMEDWYEPVFRPSLEEDERSVDVETAATVDADSLVAPTGPSL